MKRNLFLSLVLSMVLICMSAININALAPEANKFKVKELPYAYNALEPYIDEETMKLHHDKHYKAYVDNLNKSLEKYPELFNYSLIELLQNIDKIPKDIQKSVLNNAGGAYNHGFFFDIMTPEKTEVSGELKSAIEKEFGSYENFKDKFKEASLSVFGSGWAWLVKDSDGKLSITTTPNQNSPVSDNLIPIIGLDVWEHAYYLKYKNVRADYIDNWFNVVNWDKALENFGNGLEIKDK